jgi:hypothetical protein
MPPAGGISFSLTDAGTDVQRDVEVGYFCYSGEDAYRGEDIAKITIFKKKKKKREFLAFLMTLDETVPHYSTFS